MIRHGHGQFCGKAGSSANFIGGGSNANAEHGAMKPMTVGQ